MDRLMLVLAVFSIALIVLVLLSVRREHIRVEYSVSWLVAGGVLLLRSLNRGLVNWIAELLGVEDVAAGLVQQSGDGVNNALGVATGQGQDEFAGIGH